MNAFTYIYDSNNHELEKYSSDEKLRKFKDDLYMIIPTNLLYKDLDSDYVEKWIKIINDSHVKCSLVNLEQNDIDIINDKLNLEKQDVVNTYSNNEIIKKASEELLKITDNNTITGNHGAAIYAVTGSDVENAVIHDEDNKLKKLIYKNISGNKLLSHEVTLQVLEKRGRNNRTISKSRYPVDPKCFDIEINDDIINLEKFIIKHSLSYKKVFEESIINNDNVKNDFLVIKALKEDYYSNIYAEIINTAVRMLYCNEYKSMVKKAIELYSNGFNGWDSLYLSHFVLSSEECYYNNNGLFDGISYYQNKDQLLNRIINKDKLVNNSFTKYNFIDKINRDEIDKLLVKNDYKGLLEYMKLKSFGNSTDIDSFFEYIDNNSNGMNNGSFYQVLGEKDSAYLVLNNYLEEIYIKKNKFKL